MAIVKAQEERMKTFCTEITSFGHYINRIPAGSKVIEAWIRRNVIPESALKTKVGSDGYMRYGDDSYPIDMSYQELLTAAEERGYKFITIEA